MACWLALIWSGQLLFLTWPDTGYSSHVVPLLELSINDLLVLDIDKRTKVGSRRSYQSQAPKRNELDQEIGNQRRKESLQMIE